MESEKELREFEKESRELMEPRVLMEPRYLMDGVVDVHVEYEVAYLEVYPTQVKGQRWYHLWDAMYEMVNGVTTVGYLMLWNLGVFFYLHNNKIHREDEFSHLDKHIFKNTFWLCH